jgi:hypothetical protein
MPSAESNEVNREANILRVKARFIGLLLSM